MSNAGSIPAPHPHSPTQYAAFPRKENQEQPEIARESVPRESLIREVVKRDKASLHQPLAPQFPDPPVWRQTFRFASKDTALHPSYPLLAASFSDESLRFFNFKNQREIINMKMNHPVELLVFSPDGKQLMTSSNDGLRLHNVSRLLEGDQENAVSIKQPQPLIGAAAFSPNGETFIAAAVNSQKIHLIPLNNLQPSKTINLEAYDLEEDKVNSISVSQNGIIAVGSDNDHTYLIDVSQKQPRVEKFKEFGGVVAFTPDGDSVITTGQDQHLYRIDLAKLRIPGNDSFSYVLSASKVYQYTQDLGQKMHSLAVSPDGKVVAAGGSNQVYLVSRHDGKVVTAQPVKGSPLFLALTKNPDTYSLIIRHETNYSEDHTRSVEAGIDVYEFPQNL